MPALSIVATPFVPTSLPSAYSYLFGEATFNTGLLGLALANIVNIALIRVFKESLRKGLLNYFESDLRARFLSNKEAREVDSTFKRNINEDIITSNFENLATCIAQLTFLPYSMASAGFSFYALLNLFGGFNTKDALYGFGPPLATFSILGILSTADT